MSDRIFTKLEPVRRRQLGVQVARHAAGGLLASSAAGVGLGVWRWLGTGAELSPWVVPSVLLAGPVIGSIVGLLRGKSSRGAAAAVDREYHLKDRILSAVDFIRRGQPTAVHTLQVADAEAHLAGLDPRKVVPLRIPAALPYAFAALALALTLLLWPRAGVALARPAEPLEVVLAVADDAEESVDDLEEAVRKENDKKLEELIQKLTESIQEMKQPGVDTKEALAKLSEMQAAIAAQQAQFNVGLVDAQMQALGEAMASSQALEGAGKALEEGKYDRAAEQLEKAEPKFDRKETKTLKEKLAKAAKAMEEAGLAELSTATTELLESLDDSATCQGACKKLGNLARSQGRRKQISNLLSLCNSQLSECKGNCNKNSLAKIRLRKKSDKPSSNWGMAISGNTDGDKTKLDSARNREQVQGQLGEGASETETTHMPEGRQTASRSYREQYQKYRRMTEAALNSQPIPLGQRETIRKYFELIRPQESDQ